MPMLPMLQICLQKSSVVKRLTFSLSFLEHCESAHTRWSVCDPHSYNKIHTFNENEPSKAFMALEFNSTISNG